MPMRLKINDVCHAPDWTTVIIRVSGCGLRERQTIKKFPLPMCVSIVFHYVRLSQIPQRYKTFSGSLCKQFNGHLNVQ